MLLNGVDRRTGNPAKLGVEFWSGTKLRHACFVSITGVVGPGASTTAN